MHWILAVGFEALVLALSFLVVKRLERTGSTPIRICLIVLVRLFIVAGVAGVLIFFGANTMRGYLASSCILACMVLYLLLRTARDSRGHSQKKSLESADDGIPVFVLLCGAAVFVPVFWVTASRPVDVDSWAAFEGVLCWIEQECSILEFVWHYPGTWELQYIPITVLGGLHYIAWLPTAYATAGFAFAAYELARRSALPAACAALLGFSSISLYVFWAGPSGMWTFKNDMVYGLAAMCILLSVMQVRAEGLARANVLLFSISSALILLKYSGALLLIALLVLVSLYLASNRVLRVSYVFKLTGGALFAAGISTLPYYLENWIYQGNPFHPIAVSVGPLQLPGPRMLAGTSILSHASEPTVISYLIGLDPMPNRAGLLFGAVWVASVVGSLVIALIRIRRREGLREADLVLMSGAVAILLYFSSFWSAGHTPSDLGYLAYNNPSIRYAMAALVLCEVGLVAAAWSMARAFRWPLIVLLCAQIGSRVWLLFFSFPKGPTVTESLAPLELLAAMSLGVILGALFLMLRYWHFVRSAWLMLIVTIGFTGAILASERDLAPHDAPFRRATDFLLEGLSEAQASEVLIVYQIEDCNFYKFRYPFYAEMGHGNVGLTRRRGEYRTLTSGAVTPPVYVAAFHKALEECEGLSEMEKVMTQQGYEIERRNKIAILWRHEAAVNNFSERSQTPQG